MECRSDYPEVLLLIYRDSSDVSLKLMALICLKTYFTNSLATKKKAFKKQGSPLNHPVDLPEAIFGRVRATLVDSSKTEFNPLLRKQLDQVLATVCSSRFPKNVEEFFVFLKAALENLDEELKNGNINEKSYAVVKTAVKVFKALHENNQVAQSNIYQAITNLLFPPLIKVWEFLTDNLEELVNKKLTNGLQLNSQVDTLFVYMLLNAGEAHDNPVVEQCISKLIDKAQSLLVLIKKNEDNREVMSAVSEHLQKDCLVLLYEMTKLVNRTPFSFSNLIKRLLVFSFEIVKIEWKDIMISKSALLLMYSVLKQFVFYCDPDYFKTSKLNSRYKVNPPIQAHCRTTYFDFVNQESTIQELVSIMILRLMCNEEDDIKEKTIDSEIESSEVAGIDHFTKEIEISIKRICISMIELLSLRVPDIMVKLLVFLIESVVSGNMKDADLKVKDNVIMLIGLLPSIYQKLKRTDIPNIDAFLNWFSQQSRIRLTEALNIPSSVEDTQCS